MPEPIIWNNQCYIDFECELQVKSKFILDLYTLGLNRIYKNFLDIDKPLGNVIQCGVLVCDKDDYYICEEKIRNNFQNLDYSANFIKKMYKQLDEFRMLNYDFENKLKTYNVQKDDVEKYIDNLLDLMSLLCIQWLSFDVEIIKIIGKITDDEVYQMMSPLFYKPFQLRYQEAYVNLLENHSAENIDRFILEYAFLNNFDIDKNLYEDKEVLKQIIISDQNNLSKYKNDLDKFYERKQKNDLERQLLIETCYQKCDEVEKKILFNNIALIRASNDEEEERHYLQARAVRNIRSYLEQNKQNIYSSIDEILEMT